MVGMVCEASWTWFLKYWLNYLPINSLWKIVLFLFWRRWKNAKWALFIFVLLTLYTKYLQDLCSALPWKCVLSNKQIYSGESNCCSGSTFQATFLNMMCQKGFDVWFFFRKHLSLTDTYPTGLLMVASQVLFEYQHSAWNYVGFSRYLFDLK